MSFSFWHSLYMYIMFIIYFLFDSYTIWYTRHIHIEKIQKHKQQIDIIADSIQ